MIFVILTISILLLAVANGANDNFKGVATLYGSGTLGFGRALGWATATTFAGSLCAVLLAANLLTAFSGIGLVSDTLAGSPDYAAAVGLGAASTVLLATRIGMPISTTHSLFGALIGAGIASGSLVNLHQLGMAFVLPLLVSPLLAMTVSAVIYPMLRAIRLRLGVTTETCICVGSEIVEIVPSSQSALAMQRVADLGVIWGNSATCRNRYQGRVLGIDAAATLDWLHIGSAGIVSFARGLNDTPKIAAVLLISPFLSGFTTVAVTGLFIAVGGIVYGRRVAHTMSQRITTMNHGQGLTANLVTGMIVLLASPMGLPVSTTHVSCGALFGLGTATGQGDWNVIGKIAGAWLLTLPCGMALGAISFLLFGFSAMR